MQKYVNKYIRKNIQIFKVEYLMDYLTGETNLYLYSTSNISIKIWICLNIRSLLIIFEVRLIFSKYPNTYKWSFISISPYQSKVKNDTREKASYISMRLI